MFDDDDDPPCCLDLSHASYPLQSSVEQAMNPSGYVVSYNPSPSGVIDVCAEAPS